MAVLVLSFTFGFAQNKKSTTKTTSTKKNVLTSQTTTKEDGFLPVKFLKNNPTKPIDEKLLADLKSRNYDVAISDQIPMDENNTNFQYDYLTNRKNKKSILISPDGKEEEFAEDVNFINVFKDGSKIISDKCIEKPEVFHCSNVRIVSKDGTINQIPSQYRFLINMEKNHTNFKEKSFVVLFNSTTANKNIIDEKGTMLLPKDALDIELLFPPYASIKTENETTRIYHLLDKKFVDFENLKFNRALPTSKLLTMTRTTDKKFVAVDPTSKKILFEAEGSIMEIGDKEIAKDFFVVLKDNNKQVVNRKGESVYEDKVSNVRILENGNISVTDNDYKQNTYDVSGKKYLYPKFYKELGKVGNFEYIKYDKFYEISNPSTGETIYTENDRVQQYGKLGNLIYINRTFETKPGVHLAGVYDIYDKENMLIAKNKKGFNRMTDGNDSYFTIRNESDYSIIERNGKILIDSINLPYYYIRYNNSKKIFELTKKREGSAYECYDLTGNKVDCKK
ncbi:hypothetical protein [Epilithonimonas zeae]|uniref:hypothetical protein n=1 Tax=Epilithonimonas zeae TaxID=1416779 RepID=UPI00200BE252|nr:hypothetical protein [Epilithonimonas zeae]UQB69018.1 hypothetical protein KI430_00800 [Epilithonimonas zeae]